MQLTLMTMVSNMGQSVAFYESLGLTRSSEGQIDEYWNTFAIGGALLALHIAHGDDLQPATTHTQLVLNVPTGSELDEAFSRCTSLAHPVQGGIEDQGFGRFFRLTDPDGLTIQFTEEGA